jgi:hypothetical protein
MAKQVGVSTDNIIHIYDIIIKLFGAVKCNANVNDNCLRTLPAGCKFELISLTFMLHWNQPNSTNVAKQAGSL